MFSEQIPGLLYELDLIIEEDEANLSSQEKLAKKSIDVLRWALFEYCASYPNRVTKISFTDPALGQLMHLCGEVLQQDLDRSYIYRLPYDFG